MNATVLPLRRNRRLERIISRLERVGFSRDPNHPTYLRRFELRVIVEGTTVVTRFTIVNGEVTSKECEFSPSTHHRVVEAAVKAAIEFGGGK